jgi:hypothetical protein
MVTAETKDRIKLQLMLAPDGLRRQHLLQLTRLAPRSLHKALNEMLASGEVGKKKGAWLEAPTNAGVFSIYMFKYKATMPQLDDKWLPFDVAEGGVDDQAGIKRRYFSGQDDARETLARLRKTSGRWSDKTPVCYLPMFRISN